MSSNSRDRGRQYRTNLEIIRDIMLAANKDNGSRKTHLMFGANLSYYPLKKYLQKMLRCGLLFEHNSGYFVSDKGIKFLQIYKEVEKMSVKIEKHSKILNNSYKKLEQMLNMKALK